MNWRKFGRNLKDILAAALGAALVSALLTFLQYIGAHIPQLIDILTPTGGGVVAIKALRAIHT